jgi:hypothetical protein
MNLQKYFLGIIHTRHFDAQYCERYCNKNIFLSHLCLKAKVSKLLTKNKSRYINKTQIKVCFYRVYLGWSIETCVSKLYFYHISFYLFIAMYCVPKCLVWIRPNSGNDVSEWIEMQFVIQKSQRKASDV